MKKTKLTRYQCSIMHCTYNEYISSQSTTNPQTITEKPEKLEKNAEEDDEEKEIDEDLEEEDEDEEED